ncbi:uncharacterized protein LOC102295601 [Haplochromis burtoni]|uniref:uncharacterized protein LOC102295601 n=1 Tax=Haplochromis burtoni TaxID=8153 RepID=UPI0006C959E4|nr:uncharacterized protein LOC102295601 [Haplochromis burtoni]
MSLTEGLCFFFFKNSHQFTQNSLCLIVLEAILPVSHIVTFKCIFLFVSTGSQSYIGQTTPLKNTRVNKLSRKTYRSGCNKTKPYARPETEYAACQEPGPSRITQNNVDHTTPYHYEPHEDPLMFLEYLRDIELPEQQQPENPQPFGNNSDSEAIFITGPHIPASECLPSDFSDVFEYSLSDFNINDIPTMPERLRNNNSDSDIGFEECCITDSQISQAYDAYLNAAANTSTFEQSHYASKNDILSLIDAKLSQHQQTVQRDVQEIAAKLMQEIAAKLNEHKQAVQVNLQEIAAIVNQHQEAVPGNLQEIPGVLTSIHQTINNTSGVLHLINTTILNR